MYRGSLLRGRSRSIHGHFQTSFSETEAKVHVEPPREGGKIVYINGPGHLTKMSIYGKNS